MHYRKGVFASVPCQLQRLVRMTLYALLWFYASIGFISLFAGMIGLWGNLAGAVYLTALFIMLCMSAYLFLQIILDLLDTQVETGAD